MKLNEEDLTTIKEMLQKIDFMQHLRESELAALIAGFDKTEITKGETLITQDKNGEVFYIMASGKVGVYLKRKFLDKKVAELGVGSFFGEMSLISDDMRSASVVCEEDGIVYTLARDTFRKVIMTNPILADTIRKTASKRKSETRAIEMSEWMGKKIA
jgi:CRP/FNR family transcriptional regulator/CRP/FNR family cyclic AMP-dependent transcriptional regulator